MNPEKKIKVPRIIKYLLWLLLPVVAAAAIYYNLWIENPLPSDEHMLDNFKAHRADFVEAVRRYRNYPRPPHTDTSFWYKEGDTLELYKRAGIDGIDHSALNPYLPNPYSIETAKFVSEKTRNAKDFMLFHRYGVLRITPATNPRINHPDQIDDHSRYRRNTLIHGVIWKDYYFFPEAPRIENAELLGPVDQKGEYTYRLRVLPSLNRFPDHWKDFECVYRQIEPQWFLRMCNGH